MNNPKNIENQIMVIFGASGDLAYRKLIPAIFDLFENKLLPKNFAVLGVSRSEISDKAFREKMKKGIKEFAHYKESKDDVIDVFLVFLHSCAIVLERNHLITRSRSMVPQQL